MPYARGNFIPFGFRKRDVTFRVSFYIIVRKDRDSIMQSSDFS